MSDPLQASVGPASNIRKAFNSSDASTKGPLLAAIHPIAIAGFVALRAATPQPFTTILVSLPLAICRGAVSYKRQAFVLPVVSPTKPPIFKVEVFMDIANLFESKAKQLFWKPIGPSHVSGAPAAEVIVPGQAYFTIRLCEMYLAFARKLWHQIYPMVHCFTQFSGISDHAVVSPVEFSALGDMNLDRLVNVDMHLSGPNPYEGGDVSLIAGLYAVPGHDSAKALIDVVSSFASLDPATVGRTVALSSLIESAVGNILGIDQATLHLGVRDSFHPSSNPLTSGYFAGIGAAESSVDVSQLWVVNNRLQKGKDAASSSPYCEHDYMLISIEKLDARDDWHQLPEVQDYRKKFANLVGDTQFTSAEKQNRLAGLWPAFVQALADSTALTDPDRSRIATLVSTELLNRLKLQAEGNPFLRKAS